MIRKRSQTGEFWVIAEDGRRFQVFEYTDFIGAPAFEHPDAVISGLKELRTADGLFLTFKGPGLFEIVGLGLLVRKIEA
jgi:hypothetical protein